MSDALIIPFVIAQAFPAPLITGSLSQLFSKSREGRTRDSSFPVIAADPRHV